MECHLSSRSDSSYDAVCIGAGASGLVCAAALAGRGLRTLLIEQNKKSGRKLYATGNGRCNLANAVLSDSAYYHNSFAASVVTEEAVAELKQYLEQTGIPLTARGDYLYPASLQASSVVWALTDAARLAGASIRCEARVTHIRQDKDYTLQLEDGDEIRTDRLVLSMGSPAAPKLGAASADTLYRIFEDLGLPYTKFAPALCPLETVEDLSLLSGVRANAELRMNDEKESGELQFTDYGISGIVTFNLSTCCRIKDTVSVDLLPERSMDELTAFVLKQDPKRRLFAVLNGLLHEKLCSYLMISCFGEAAVKEATEHFSEADIRRLFQSAKELQLTVKGKRGELGQACRGGVSTSVISPENFSVTGNESVPARASLAVTGELLDVTGRCGGYNLMFAMISGRKAGLSL